MVKGVGGPTEPYRPHLNASNKGGYAWDGKLVAQTGSGLLGWLKALTESTLVGTRIVP